MKKTLYSLIVLGGFITAALPTASFAVTASPINPFTTPLTVGTRNSTDVAKLQQFLFDQGYLKVIPTGNYGAITTAAVATFQKNHNISATGNFNSQTMAVANAVKAQDLIKHPVATIGITSVSKKAPTNLMAAIFEIFSGSSNTKTLKWSTDSYPAHLGVNINLIQKVSDSPASYAFVRSLGKDIPNVGSFTWTPQSNETSANLYVEVTCGSKTPATQACQVNEAPLKLN